MSRQMKVIIALLLVMGVIIEGVTYKIVRSKMSNAKSAYDDCKSEYDEKIKERESLEYPTKVFGYGNVLDLLSKNLNAKITKFEKGESSDRIIVKIEATAEEHELNRIIFSISDMENFQTLKKLRVISSDKSQIHIAIDAEYKINR